MSIISVLFLVCSDSGGSWPLVFQHWRPLFVLLGFQTEPYKAFDFGLP